MSEHALLEEPQFDFDTLREKLAAWKAAGASRVFFEWNTGPGPNLVHYSCRRSHTCLDLGMPVGWRRSQGAVQDRG